MTRKQKRLTLIGTAMVFIFAAVGIILVSLNDQIVYFKSPSDLAEEPAEPGIRLRVGGLVQEGSVEYGEGTKVRFTVHDNASVISIAYEGIVPDLFREGQGIIAEGTFDRDGLFEADMLLAKHDENYVPRELADALKATSDQAYE